MSWRRIFLLAAILLLTIVGATWFVLQRSGVATGLVHTFLASVLAPKFQLQSASIDLFGGNLQLDSLQVDDPARPGQQLLAVESLALEIETDPLGDVLAIHGVEIDDLAVDIDLTEGRAPDLARLLKKQPAAGDGMHATITPVTVHRGQLRLRLRADLPVLELVDVELELQRVRADDGDGAASRQHGVLRGSARCRNLDLEVELRGTVDLVKSTVRLQAQVTGVALDAAFLQRLQPWLPQPLPADPGHGRLQKLICWLSAGLDGVAPAEFGTTFEIEDLHLQLAQLPIPVQAASLHGIADTRDGGTAQFTARHLLAAGDSEVVAKITGLRAEPSIEIRGKGRSVPLDHVVEQALRTFPAGRNVVEGLRPRAGLADFDLYLRDPGGAREIVDLDLHLREVALAYHGFGPPATRVSFPLPIVQANGRVHLRDDVVSIEDVAAQIAPEAGGGPITMSGRVEPESSGSDQVSIDIQAPSLPFTPSLRNAFATLLRDDGTLYDQFQPKGAAAVRLRIRPAGAPDGDWQVRVEPLGAEITWSRFPLAMRDVRGQILARAEGLQIDLTCAHGEARAQVKGRLLAPAERPGSIAGGRVEMHVKASNVAMDQDLRAASLVLAPLLVGVWDELQPSGSCSTDLSVRRERADAPMLYDMTLGIERGRALPRSLPLPVTGLTGELVVHGQGDRIDVQVDAVRGRLQERNGTGAELAVVGTVHTHPRHTEDLTAVVRSLDLDAELGRVLEEAGAVGRGTWSVLRPSGRVDVISRQRITGSDPPVRDYTVLMRDVRSDAEMLPRPATSVTGELSIDAGVLSFRDVRALVGSAQVTCSRGRVGPTAAKDRTEVAFDVSAERFPLDDNFARLFLGPLRQAVVDRQLRGALNINGLSLKFLLPIDGGDTPIETVLQGQVEALDVEMLLGTRLQAVNGVVTLQESHVTAGGGTLRGNLTKGSFVLLGHACFDAQADFTADAERFVMRGLDLTLHGGKVKGRVADGDSLVYVLSSDREPGRLSADLTVDGMSLGEFLRDSGFTGAVYSGNTTGWVRLNELRGYDLIDVDAEGALTVSNGDLGTVQVFTAIYALMAERNRPRFDSLSLQFRIKDRVLEFTDLALRSALLDVQGNGTLTMEGYLNVTLKLDSLLGGGADVFFVPALIPLLTSNLFRFHLYGHLRDLHAEQRWIGQRDPRRQRLQPVPPRLDRPPRPVF